MTITRSIMRVVESVTNIWWKLISRFFIAHYFNYMGSKTTIVAPERLFNGECISIGRGTYIAGHAWLSAERIGQAEPQMIIGNGCRIGHWAHIIVAGRVEIGDSVLMADKVYIADVQHSYEDISLPIMAQPLHLSGPVKIGNGSWIGENACLMGCQIGCHCVVGANAVVVGGEYPDYSVLAGVPAKIIKRYDKDSGIWRRTDAEGEFIDA